MIQVIPLFLPINADCSVVRGERLSPSTLTRARSSATIRGAYLSYHPNKTPMTEIIEVLFNVVSPIFLVFGFAILVGRTINPDPRAVSALLIYLFLPALAFRGMSTVALDPNLAGIAIVSASIHIIMAIIAYTVARWLKLDKRAAGAFILSVMLINAANYGIPFNRFAFGTEGEQNAIVFWVVSVIVGNIAGVFFASQGSSGSLRQTLKNVLLVPITHATLLGLLFNLTQWDVPLPLERSIDILADAGIPGMMTLLGLQLARAKLRGRLVPIFVAAGLRLVLAPLIALGIALLLGMDGITLKVAVLESAMPTAVVATAFAMQFGSDSDFTTSVTLVSTVLSTVTLTLILLLLGGPTV